MPHTQRKLFMKFSFLIFILACLALVNIVNAQPLVTIEEVIEIALQKNYDIKVAQATAATQFTDKKFIYGAFLPTLNLGGNYNKNFNNIINQSFGQDEKHYNGLSFSTGPSPSIQTTWTVFDGTKMFSTRKRLLQLADWGEINIKNQMMNTAAATMTNFYNIVRQQEQLKAIKEVMDVNLERVKLAERKLEVGTGAKPELLQAKVDLNAQRTLAIQQEILIQQIKDQLNGQLGFGLPDQFTIADTIPININLNFEDIVSSIENANQTVLAAKKNLEVATTAVKENQAGRMPVVQLTSSYNFSRTENKIQYGSIQQLTQTLFFSYGIGVSIPILNNLNVSRLVEQAKVTQSRLQSVYNQQKAIAIVGVRNAFSNYENSKRILIIQEENLLIAKENVDIALAGFRRGIITSLDLRTAQQSLSDAYNQLIAARFSCKSSEIELLRLSGTLLK